MGDCLTQSRCPRSLPALWLPAQLAPPALRARWLWWHQSYRRLTCSAQFLASFDRRSGRPARPSQPMAKPSYVNWWVAIDVDSSQASHHVVSFTQHWRWRSPCRCCCPLRGDARLNLTRHVHDGQISVSTFWWRKLSQSAGTNCSSNCANGNLITAKRLSMETKLPHIIFRLCFALKHTKNYPAELNQRVAKRTTISHFPCGSSHSIPSANLDRHGCMLRYPREQAAFVSNLGFMRLFSPRSQ